MVGSRCARSLSDFGTRAPFSTRHHGNRRPNLWLARTQSGPPGSPRQQSRERKAASAPQPPKGAISSGIRRLTGNIEDCLQRGAGRRSGRRGAGGGLAAAVRNPQPSYAHDRISSHYLSGLREATWKASSKGNRSARSWPEEARSQLISGTYLVLLARSYVGWGGHPRLMCVRCVCTRDSDRSKPQIWGAPHPTGHFIGVSKGGTFQAGKRVWEAIARHSPPSSAPPLRFLVMHTAPCTFLSLS